MHGHSELDDPTEPFSRSEIDRKRLQVERAGDPREDERSVTLGGSTVPLDARPEPTADVLSADEGGEAAAALTLEGSQGPELLQDGDSRGELRGEVSEATGELELAAERRPAERGVTGHEGDAERQPQAEPQAEADPDWFEINGRRFRVCLEAFDHIGYSGPPRGMIGSADLALASGVINGEAGAPFRSQPRLTTVQPAAAPHADEPSLAIEASGDDLDADEEEVVWRDSSRWTGVTVIVLVVVASVAIWHWRRPSVTASLEEGEQRAQRWLTGVVQSHEEEGEDVPPQVGATESGGHIAKGETGGPDRSDTSEVSDEPAGPEGPDEKSEEQRPPTPEDSPEVWKSATCRSHRKRAEAALREGDWRELEELARRRRCWSRSRKAKALQLRALFEQERFEKCVEAGAGGTSKEVKKWTSNCERALR